jgi:hypothetical protein
MRALDGRRIAGQRIIAAGRLTRVPRPGLPEVAGRLGRAFSRAITPAERRAALAARREDWAELIGVVAAASPDAHDPLRSLHVASWLASTLELRALAHAAPGGTVAVIDEGLVQRTPSVLGPSPSDSALVHYLGLLPHTTLYVHLEADPEHLVARLRARDRVIDRHIGLDDAALLQSVREDARLFARLARELEDLGSPMMSVGGGEDTVVAALVERLTVVTR